MSNVCTRCGKERIVIKEWDEGIETERRSHSIHYIKTSCPDIECQKLVEQGIEKEKLKNETRRAEKVEAERVQKEERQKRIEQMLLRPNKKNRK